MSENALSVEELAALEGVDFADVESVEEAEASDADTTAPAPPEPAVTDPEWQEYVLKHFRDNEMDRDGHPLVHGLRRVTRLLLGPITESVARVVQAPTFVPGQERMTMLTPAVVEYTVKVLWCKPERKCAVAFPVTVTDVADVYFGNTDADFARYPTATAATRAEARCLRKLLQLRTCASEELTAVPLAESSVDGLVTPTQLTFLNVLCKRLDIDAVKFVNAGKRRYARVQDVPYGTASDMLQHLSALQNEPDKIPEKLRGYDPNWQRG